MENSDRLIIPTLRGFRDALKPTVTDSSCKAVLFNPMDNNYYLANNTIYYKNHPLNENEVFELAANPNINKPLKEGPLVYGMFSLLYTNYDLRNRTEFRVTESDLCKCLGLSTGSKGFKLTEKLMELSNVFATIDGKGAFNLFELKEQESCLIIKSVYMSTLLNMIINEASNEFGESAKYYTDKVHLNIVSTKQKTAALIVIELASLIARSRGKYSHISLKTLFYYVPQLMAIYLNNYSTSLKNRQLSRIFNAVDGIIQVKTAFPDELEELNISIPELSIKNLNAVIKITFKSYYKDKKVI